MNTINEMVNKISVKHDSKIKKLCEPLNTCFGINHFFMSRTLSDGRFFSIGSNLNMHEYYYCNRKFECSPFHKNPNLLSSGFYSYNQHKEKTFQNSIDEVQQNTGCKLIAGNSYKKSNTLTRFGYCASPSLDTDKLQLLLQQNIPLLNAFNTYFMNEIKSVIDSASNYAISLPHEIGSRYNEPLLQGSQLLNIENRLVFLKEIGIVNENTILTKREFEYLENLTRGWTNCQIATHMHLSPRTVENAVQLLKEKLNCNSKIELIEIAKLFYS